MSETTLTWEAISPFNRLERIRVPGGWLYRTAHGDAVALCFVPLVPDDPVVPEEPWRTAYAR
jgi:hypothetical protein